MRFLKLFLALGTFGIFTSFAWGNIKFNGRVLSEFKSGPIELARISIPSLKKKLYTNSDGQFSVSLPLPKNTQKAYKIFITAGGYQTLEKEIVLDRKAKGITETFLLKPVSVRTKGFKIKSKGERQSLGRKTFSQEELKETPAGFGDALGALTSLPGIIKSEGFSGSLILRGSIDDGNKYIVDGIPLFYPKHYGGFSLVLPNNVISKAHVFASSPPIEFSQVYGGVIEIETKEHVEGFEGKIDSIPLSLTSVYLQGNLGEGFLPYLSNSNPQRDIIDSTAPLKKLDLGGVDKKRGDWSAGARYGYLDTVFRPIYDILSPSQQNIQINYPEFWDYQAKVRFFISRDRKHQVKVFALGSIDSYKKQPEKISDSERTQKLLENNDVIANVTEIDSDIYSHTQSLYYIYSPNTKVKNRFIIYHALNQNSNYKLVPNIPEIELAQREIRNRLRTHVFAAKNTYSWNYWKDTASLKWGTEIQYITYNSSGETDFVKLDNFSAGNLSVVVTRPGFKASDVFEVTDANFNSTNAYLSSYLKHEFEYEGWQFNLGSRFNYLNRTNGIAPDGWIHLGHEFLTDTTVSTAAGYYTSFPQINFYKINKPLSQQYQISTLNAAPERGAHIALGVEQELWDRFNIKGEGFFNSFYDVLYLDYDSGQASYISKTSDLRHAGFEIFFRKEAAQNRADYFYWISYTLTDSVFKNEDTDNQFVPYTFEQEHSIKLVAGYKWLLHQVGLRYEVYSGFAYTPYTGHESFPSPLDANRTYYLPNTAGAGTNSNNYPLAHRLDVRYTYINYSSWGKWIAYIEVLNVYNFRPDKRQSWNYFKPLGTSNPSLEPSPSDLPVLINLGIELNF